MRLIRRIEQNNTIDHSRFLVALGVAFARHDRASAEPAGSLGCVDLERIDVAVSLENTQVCVQEDAGGQRTTQKG
jgi:hypothetical protein